LVLQQFFGCHVEVTTLIWICDDQWVAREVGLMRRSSFVSAARNGDPAAHHQVLLVRASGTDDGWFEDRLRTPLCLQRTIGWHARVLHRSGLFCATRVRLMPTGTRARTT
jgi:hypothetical protein